MNVPTNSAMRRIYIDSDVFLNTWFREMHKWTPVFHYAERILEKIIDCTFFLIISDLTLEELSKKIPLPVSRVKSEYFSEYERRQKLKVVEVTRDVSDEASRLPTHHADAIHALVARRENALLVTRNIRHYRNVARILKLRVLRPEELT